MLKFQEPSCVLKMGFALSKWPHLHRAYLVTVPKYLSFCSCNLVLECVEQECDFWEENRLYEPKNQNNQIYNLSNHMWWKQVIVIIYFIFFPFLWCSFRFWPSKLNIDWFFCELHLGVAPYEELLGKFWLWIWRCFWVIERDSSLNGFR